MDELKPPQHAAIEVQVVGHLVVVGIGAAPQQQPRQRLARGVRRAIFLAFADHPDQGGVARVTRREEGVGVGAGVEQRRGDGHRVGLRRRQRQPGVAQVQQRLPPLGAQVAVEVAAVPHAAAARPRLPGAPPGQPGLLRQRLTDGVEVAADDLGMERGPGQVGEAIEQPERRVPRAAEVAAAAHVVVGTGVVEEAGHQRRLARVGGGPRGKGLAERGPARQPELAGQGVLDVAQGGGGGRTLERAGQPGARVGASGAERLEPALRFAGEVLETAVGREGPGHDLPPWRLESAEHRLGRRFGDVSCEPDWVEESSLPRTRGAPAHAGSHNAGPGAACQAGGRVTTGIRPPAPNPALAAPPWPPRPPAAPSRAR